MEGKMGNEEPVPFPTPTFFKFSSLPAELRTTIWVLAVPVQNRLVDSPKLRAIKHAPCPVLFLVCKEAKACAETQYQRLQRYRKGYNLLMGDLVPVIGAQGLPISLDHDIFLIQEGAWKCWQSIEFNWETAEPNWEMVESNWEMGEPNWETVVSNWEMVEPNWETVESSNPMEVAIASRKNGTKLTNACKKIEKFSASGVRRVCVTCTHCRAHSGRSKVKQGDWLADLCYSCSCLCEQVFYPGTRVVSDHPPQEELEWAWKWTHRVQEVFHLHYSRDSAKQVFPSLGACRCSLCRPRKRMDVEYLNLVKDDMPKDPDYITHDRLFRRSRELWYSISCSDH